MGQFLPGTDFVTSGYSVMPREDNTFGGGNYDADDLDEWLTVQRDWQVDAGIEPVAEDERARACARAGGARRPGGVRRARLPAGHRRGGRGGHVRLRRAATCPTATARPTSRRPTACSTRASPALDVVRALDDAGFDDVAEADRSACSASASRADYLQTSAIIEPDGTVRSAVNDPNRYAGPGTGYRLEGERWQLLQQLPYVLDPREQARRRTEAPSAVGERMLPR